MEVGSIVETVCCFEELRKIWGYPYPKKGDVLIISHIEEHPVPPDPGEAHMVLLHFEELPSLVGVCDQTFDGKPNFLELTLPEAMEESIEEVFEPVLTI